MTQKRTPLPWHLEHGHKMAGNGIYWQIHDGSDAICCNQFCYADNSEANAEFIVRACNSHYELLEALKAARENIWDNWRPNTARSMSRRDALIGKIDAALAKAEGGAA